MENDSETCTIKLATIKNPQQISESKNDPSNVTFKFNEKRNIFKRYSWKRKDSVQSYRKKKVTMGRVFYLFCTTTSIRGMNKIPKGPIFLRILWFLFVLIMTTGLTVATSFMILEFLQYDVNVHTKIILDDNSSFPALTICHHHPFSKKGFEHWDNGTVMSPSEFNKYLRNLSNSNFQSNEYYNGMVTSHSDTMSMYYQNLNMNESFIIGHDKRVYLTCMNQLGFGVNFDDDCSNLQFTSFHRLSLHEYFNCHTFQPANITDSYLFDSINIVVSLEPKPDYKTHEQAFIVETFQRAEGLRVVVHETGSFPDLAQDGLHVEPGKMNEIKYQPIHHKRVNTQTKPCVDSNDLTTFKDLDQTFLKDKKNCILLKKQERIMAKCKCIFVSFPRPVEPTDDLPYCGRIPKNGNISLISDRINCISTIVDNPTFQKELERTTCFPRCDILTFESTVSITKWGATAWHLHWIRETNKALNLAKPLENMKVYETKGYKMWLDYANKTNLSDIKLKDDHFLKGENFAYIVLQRKSKNTVVKQEKLVTTPYVLLSRIGGVCSLTIGLTAAFVVEFIEFIYRFYNHSDNNNTNTNKNNNNNNNNNKQNCQIMSSKKSDENIRKLSKEIHNQNQEYKHNETKFQTINLSELKPETQEDINNLLTES